MRGYMQPDGNAGTTASPEDQASAAAEDEWSGVGDKPLKDHVRNDTTVDLEEGGRVGVTIGEVVKDWGGDYKPRPDAEAAGSINTPPYSMSDQVARAQYLANGPQFEPDFDVHDYEEGEVVPPGKDISGLIVPRYD